MHHIAQALQICSTPHHRGQELSSDSVKGATGENSVLGGKPQDRVEYTPARLLHGQSPTLFRFSKQIPVTNQLSPAKLAGAAFEKHAGDIMHRPPGMEEAGRNTAGTGSENHRLEYFPTRLSSYQLGSTPVPMRRPPLAFRCSVFVAVALVVVSLVVVSFAGCVFCNYHSQLPPRHIQFVREATIPPVEASVQGS